MNPGLPQGFIKFGTVAYIVLRALHNGPSTTRELVDTLHLPQGQVAEAVSQLKTYKYIFIRSYEKHIAVYGLKKNYDLKPFKALTQKERDARYSTKRRKPKPMSVFNYRG